jgi:hypothetical protein
MLNEQIKATLKDACQKLTGPKKRAFMAKVAKDYFDASAVCVEGLFDLCQILQAVIYRDGWKFLVKTHGIDRLLEVDKISGWFFDNTLDELRYHCLIAGYDPLTDFIGDYDEKTGVFSPKQGGEYNVMWDAWNS